MQTQSFFFYLHGFLERTTDWLLVSASSISFAMPFVYTLSKRHLSFIPLRFLSPKSFAAQTFSGIPVASSISFAMPFVYTLSKSHLSFIPLRFLSPRQNKFRIIRGNFSLIFFEKLPLIHFTVLSLPKMFFCKKHFGGPSIVIFCGANFFRGPRFASSVSVVTTFRGKVIPSSLHCSSSSHKSFVWFSFFYLQTVFGAGSRRELLLNFLPPHDKILPEQFLPLFSCSHLGVVAIYYK